MFDDFSQRLTLKRRLAVLRRSDPHSKEIIAIHKRLDWLESNELLTKAYRLGIAVDLKELYVPQPDSPLPKYFMVKDGEIVDLDPPDPPAAEGNQPQFRPAAMNPDAMSVLRKTVRDERFRRMEQWVKLISALVAGLTGLLGVIIGLVALLLHR